MEFQESRMEGEKKTNEPAITIKQDHIYWRKKLPKGFQYYMERLMRGIVRVQPTNIPLFAAAYFGELLQQRDRELENLPETSYLHRIEGNMKQPWYGQDPSLRITTIMQTSSTLLTTFVKPSEYCQTVEEPKSEGVQVDFPKEEGTQTDRCLHLCSPLQDPEKTRPKCQCDETQTSATTLTREMRSDETQTCSTGRSPLGDKKSQTCPCGGPRNRKCMHQHMVTRPVIIHQTCTCPPCRMPGAVGAQRSVCVPPGQFGASSCAAHHTCQGAAPVTCGYHQNQVCPVDQSGGDPSMRQERPLKVGPQKTIFDSAGNFGNVSVTQSTALEIPQSEEPGSRLPPSPQNMPLKFNASTSCSFLIERKHCTLSSSDSGSRSSSSETLDDQPRQDRRHHRHHHHHHHHSHRHHKRGEKNKKGGDQARTEPEPLPAPIYQIFQAPPWLQQPAELAFPFGWPSFLSSVQASQFPRAVPAQPFNPYQPAVMPPVQVNVGYPSVGPLPSDVSCCPCARRALDGARAAGQSKDSDICRCQAAHIQTREVATQKEDGTNIEAVSHLVQQVSQKSVSACQSVKTTSVEMKDELTISYRTVCSQASASSEPEIDVFPQTSSSAQNALKKVPTEIKSSYKSVFCQTSLGENSQEFVQEVSRDPSSSVCSDVIHLLLDRSPSADGKPVKVGEPCVCSLSRKGPGQRFFSPQESKEENQVAICPNCTAQKPSPIQKISLDTKSSEDNLAKSGWMLNLLESLYDEPLENTMTTVQCSKCLQEKKSQPKNVPGQIPKPEVLLQTHTLYSVNGLALENTSETPPLELMAPLSKQQEEYLAAYKAYENVMKMRSQTVPGNQVLTHEVLVENQQATTSTLQGTSRTSPLDIRAPLSTKQENLAFHIPEDSAMELRPEEVSRNQVLKPDFLLENHHTPITNASWLPLQDTSEILPLENRTPSSTIPKEKFAFHRLDNSTVKLQSPTVPGNQLEKHGAPLQEHYAAAVESKNRVSSAGISDIPRQEVNDVPTRRNQQTPTNTVNYLPFEDTSEIPPLELRGPLSAGQEENMAFYKADESATALTPRVVSGNHPERQRASLQEHYEAAIESKKRVSSAGISDIPWQEVNDIPTRRNQQTPTNTVNYLPFENTSEIPPLELRGALSAVQEENMAFYNADENATALTARVVSENHPERQRASLQEHYEAAIESKKRVSSADISDIPRQEVNDVPTRRNQQTPTNAVNYLPFEDTSEIPPLELRGPLSAGQEENMRFYKADENAIGLTPRVVSENQPERQRTSLQEHYEAAVESKNRVSSAGISDIPRQEVNDILTRRNQQTPTNTVNYLPTEDTSEIPPLELRGALSAVQEENMAFYNADENATALTARVVSGNHPERQRASLQEHYEAAVESKKRVSSAGISDIPWQEVNDIPTRRNQQTPTNTVNYLPLQGTSEIPPLELRGSLSAVEEENMAFYNADENAIERTPRVVSGNQPERQRASLQEHSRPAFESENELPSAVISDITPQNLDNALAGRQGQNVTFSRPVQNVVHSESNRPPELQIFESSRITELHGFDSKATKDMNDPLYQSIYKQQTIPEQQALASKTDKTIEDLSSQNISKIQLVHGQQPLDSKTNEGIQDVSSETFYKMQTFPMQQPLASKHNEDLKDLSSQTICKMQTIPCQQPLESKPGKSITKLPSQTIPQRQSFPRQQTLELKPGENINGLSSQTISQRQAMPGQRPLESKPGENINGLSSQTIPQRQTMPGERPLESKPGENINGVSQTIPQRQTMPGERPLESKAGENINGLSSQTIPQRQSFPRQQTLELKPGENINGLSSQTISQRQAMPGQRPLESKPGENINGVSSQTIPQRQTMAGQRPLESKAGENINGVSSQTIPQRQTMAGQRPLESKPGENINGLSSQTIPQRQTMPGQRPLESKPGENINGLSSQTIPQRQTMPGERPLESKAGENINGLSSQTIPQRQTMRGQRPLESKPGENINGLSPQTIPQRQTMPGERPLESKPGENINGLSYQGIPKREIFSRQNPRKPVPTEDVAEIVSSTFRGNQPLESKIVEGLKELPRQPVPQMQTIAGRQPLVKGPVEGMKDLPCRTTSTMQPDARQQPLDSKRDEDPKNISSQPISKMQNGIGQQPLKSKPSEGLPELSSQTIPQMQGTPCKPPASNAIKAMKKQPSEIIYQRPTTLAQQLGECNLVDGFPTFQSQTTPIIQTGSGRQPLESKLFEGKQNVPCQTILKTLRVRELLKSKVVEAEIERRSQTFSRPHPVLGQNMAELHSNTVPGVQPLISKDLKSKGQKHLAMDISTAAVKKQPVHVALGINQLTSTDSFTTDEGQRRSFSVSVQSVNEVSRKDISSTRSEATLLPTRPRATNTSKSAGQDIAKRAPQGTVPKVTISFTISLSKEGVTPNSTKSGRDTSVPLKASEPQMNRFKAGTDEKRPSRVRRYCQIPHSHSNIHTKTRSCSRSCCRSSGSSGTCSGASCCEDCRDEASSRGWDSHSDAEFSPSSSRSSTSWRGSSDSGCSHSTATDQSSCTCLNDKNETSVTSISPSSISFAVSINRPLGKTILTPPF